MAKRKQRAKRICVVGAGRWGRNHIKTLDGLGCLAGVVDSSETARNEFARLYPKAKMFGNVRDAVAADFDGFTVATPAETHVEVATFLLENDKPVLVEKPLALTAAEADGLRELAAARRVPLMVGHLLLFHPAVRKIKELVEAGKIGKLEYLYSNRLNLGTVRTEENILWSFAPHDISIFQYLIGARPTEIVSRGGAFIQPHLHDSTMTVLTYPDNIVGHIFVSWLHPFKEHRLVVIGSKGMLSYEDSSEAKELLFYEKGIDWVQGEPIKRDGPTEKIAFEPAMPLTEELKYFVERLDGGEIEWADGANAVEVLEILERATKSLVGAASAEGEAKGTKGTAGTKGTEETEAKPAYFVHSSSYVDDNVEIGEGTKVWHFSHVQSGARLGAKCTLGQNVNVANNVTIGDNCKIQNNVSIYEGVTLEDHVFCGPSMVFTNVLDPRCKYPQRGSDHYVKTLVRHGASIGANATIVCGVTIGRHAFVAAGAVVTRDAPDFGLMVGVPARRTGWVCECGEVLPSFENAIKCPRCGLKYTLADGALLPDV